MNEDQNYLELVLQSQDMDDDSAELKELRSHRADVEVLLRDAFKDASPTIRYGGSKAKGTMNRESYDLDIICYFPAEDTSAGSSLEDIYNNVYKALDQKYYVTKKNSALRLKSKDPKTYARDFHIDVVPGRFTDGNKGDCFIYQSMADKKRLKTNLDVHINHVSKSGVVDAIRLLKLWKTRRGLSVRQFVWELLIIKLLKGKSSLSLPKQLEHVWTVLRDTRDPMNIEDPANPQGNDLSTFLATGIWLELSTAAGNALHAIENSGWQTVFGELKEAHGVEREELLVAAANISTSKNKPWSECL